MPGPPPTATVTGEFYDADGQPAAGSVEFQLDGQLRSASGNYIVAPSVVEVTLDAAGAFSVVLVPNNHAAFVANDHRYRVTVRLDGAPEERFDIDVPDLGGDLADLRP